jgi:Homeodomain-like domain
MAEKAEIARRLLARGLTVRQIRTQLRCSATFVQRIRDEEAALQKKAS